LLFYLPEDHGVLVDALLALQRVQRCNGGGAIVGDPARDAPELRGESPNVRGCRGGHPAWWCRVRLSQGRPRGDPGEAERAEHAEHAVEEVLQAGPAAAAGPPWSWCPRRGPRGGHGDARRDGDGEMALPSAARPPTAGARPAPRGGLHHAPAADPRPAPRAAHGRRLLPVVLGTSEGVRQRGQWQHAGTSTTGRELLPRPLIKPGAAKKSGFFISSSQWKRPRARTPARSSTAIRDQTQSHTRSGG
jgi:hypothetical protein